MPTPTAPLNEQFRECAPVPSQHKPVTVQVLVKYFKHLNKSCCNCKCCENQCRCTATTILTDVLDVTTFEGLPNTQGTVLRGCTGLTDPQRAPLRALGQWRRSARSRNEAEARQTWPGYGAGPPKRWLQKTLGLTAPKARSLGAQLTSAAGGENHRGGTLWKPGGTLVELGNHSK